MFHVKGIRTILSIRWQGKITNKDGLDRTDVHPVIGITGWVHLKKTMKISIL